MIIGSKDMSHGIILNNNEITSPNAEKLLGILVDSKLNFESHIDPISEKRPKNKCHSQVKKTTLLSSK